MNETERKIVTSIVFGEKGFGKSQNGCAFLQKEDAFKTIKSKRFSTYETSANSSTIDEITRYYIDTPDFTFDSYENSFEIEQIEQMYEFLRKWKHGINSFFILLNGVSPRFTEKLKKIIIIINDIFNDPNIWTHTGIIFTKCFNQNSRKYLKVSKEYLKIYNFIKNLPGCSDIDPQIPIFFVNSVKWKTDKYTQDGYQRMFEFSSQNYPISCSEIQLQTYKKGKFF